MAASSTAHPHSHHWSSNREKIAFGWPHQAVAVLFVLLGAAFVTVTLTANLFHVGPAFDRLTNDFRPIMTQQELQADQQSINGLSAAATEIQTKMLPALGQQLGMTTDQLNGMISQQYPDVAAGLAAIPQITPTFTGLITTLDQQRPYFQAADAIPTSSLPAASVPWTLLVVGLLTAGFGVWIWFSPRAGSIAMAILGAALIIGPLALNLPHKASYADTLNANLKPVYNQQLIDQANASLTTLSKMGTQIQQNMVPGLAVAMKMTPDQVNAFIGQNFPATAAALTSMPDSMTRFQNMVGAFQNRLADYQVLKPVSLVPIVWFMIGGGIAMFLIGGAGVAVAGKGTGKGRRAV